jgi:hypothetical protein
MPLSTTKYWLHCSAICRRPTMQLNEHRSQYDAADPENRRVADELERRWNDALLRVAAIRAWITAVASSAIPAVSVQSITIVGSGRFRNSRTGNLEP